MLIDVCENGLRIRVICIDHPKRKLNEVHYARCVGIEIGLFSRPLSECRFCAAAEPDTFCSSTVRVALEPSAVPAPRSPCT